MRSPERIGRYEIHRALGHGAAGVVYLARDPLIDRQIAIKTLRRDLDDTCTDEYRQRFLREARAAGRLSHPNIVTVFDIGEDLGHEEAFIVMELLDGTNLKDALALGTGYDAHRAVHLTATLAEALDYAHRQGVVHRDIKPANIILTADGNVKITDFGIARLDTSDLTAKGAVIGTPNYMSPEQIRGAAVDGRSDLYSLGVILYELVTGRRPFVGGSLPELLINIASQPTPDPLAARPGLPAPLAAVIVRCLAKNPDDRFQTGSALALALRCLDLSGCPVTPPNGSDDRLAGSGPGIGPLRPELLQPVLPDLLATRTRDTARITDGLTEPPTASRWVAAAKATVAARWFLPLTIGLGLLLALAVGTLIARLDIPGTSEGFERVEVAAQLAPADSPPPPTPSLTSTLVVAHKNRLSAGAISLWVDGSKVWTQQLAAEKGVLKRFKRLGGVAVEQSIPVTEGRHEIEVHISGTSMKVEARASIQGDFRADGTRRLEVGLNPYTDRLTLAWAE